MFDTLEGAVRAHRDAAAEHHRARDLHDNTTMDAAISRIREIEQYLRSRGRPELIEPLTLEWVTEGGDVAEHAHYHALVNHLVGR